MSWLPENLQERQYNIYSLTNSLNEDLLNIYVML